MTFLIGFCFSALCACREKLIQCFVPGLRLGEGYGVNLCKGPFKAQRVDLYKAGKVLLLFLIVFLFFLLMDIVNLGAGHSLFLQVASRQLRGNIGLDGHLSQ